MKIRHSACSLLAAISSPVWANCGSNACQNMTITRLFISTNNKIYVKISDNITSLNCTPVEGQYLTLLRSSPNSDAIYSMLMTTQAMGRVLTRIRIVEGTAGCTIQYVWQD